LKKRKRIFARNLANLPSLLAVDGLHPRRKSHHLAVDSTTRKRTMIVQDGRPERGLLPPVVVAHLPDEEE
jgi:hypothetical protein